MGYSTTMRYTGMSGVDTASMVTQLMQAEAMRKNSVFQQRQLLQYTQDAYRGVSSSVRSFQSSFLSFSSTSSIVNMRSTSSFGTNKANVSGADGLELASTKGNVTVSNAATTGDYKFEVKSVASNEKRLGGSLSSNTKIDVDLTGNKLDDTDSFDVTLNGVTRSIDFSKYDGATDKDRLQEAFNAEFGANKITVTDTGIEVAAGNTLSISEGSIKDVSQTLGADLPDEFSVVSSDRFYTNGSIAESVTEDINQTFKFVDSNDKEHTVELSLKAEDFPDGEITREQYVEKLNEKINEKLTGESLPSVNAKTDAQGRIYFDGNDLKSFNGTELEGRLTDDVSMKVGGEAIEITLKDGMTKEEYVSEVNRALKASGNSNITASLDGSRMQFKVTAATNESISIQYGGDTSTLAPTSSIQDLGITSGDTTAISTSDSLKDALGVTGSGTLTVNGVDIDYTEETSLKDFMSSLNNSGANVKLSFSETTGKFTLEGTETGAINAIKIEGDDEVLQKMNLTGSDYDTISTAQDTIIGYDGIDLVRESSVVTIDGITLDLNQNTVDNATGATNPTVINVNVEKDNDSTVDNIKKFIEAYNEMVEELQDEVSTNRPKSGSYSYYEPLTEEERSAMSDTEQEQWDEKAKQGMLYNDSLLRRFTSTVRSISYDKVSLPDGSSISLQDLGITTGDYKDGAKLVIDEEKLETAISKYGDDIATLFTKSGEGIADKMNTAIEDAFGTRGYVTEKAGRENSVTVNENTLSRAISKKDDELFDMTQYLIDKENYYYTMFAAMESAIIQSNNQMSYLMSM